MRGEQRSHILIGPVARQQNKPSRNSILRRWLAGSVGFLTAILTVWCPVAVSPPRSIVQQKCLQMDRTEFSAALSPPRLVPCRPSTLEYLERSLSLSCPQETCHAAFSPKFWFDRMTDRLKPPTAGKAVFTPVQLTENLELDTTSYDIPRFVG